MKLWSKFKYALLKWLLDDICGKSGECKDCCMNRLEHVYRNGTTTWTCSENFAFKRAREVWGLEE